MRKSRSSRLLEILSRYARVVVVAHDYPDPDAIAAGWALHWMIRRVLDLDVRLVAGGSVVRAENRRMVELLKPPLELVDEVDLAEGTATVLVDCGPSSGNHLLSRASLRPVANIDHHLTTEGQGPSLPFRDVRTSAAATTSIAGGYLREQQLQPTPALATAMLYAMRTETQGYEIHFTRSDRSIFSWLTERADPSRLADIENAPLPLEYFSDLVLALQSTFLYKSAAFCLLPRAEGPATAAEVADLLVRCENVDRVLCGAMTGRDLAISIRTGPGAGSASDLVRTVIAELGPRGGHEHRAGGRIPDAGEPGRLSQDLHDKLRQRWLAACGADRQRGIRLVARREIIEHLRT